MARTFWQTRAAAPSIHASLPEGGFPGDMVLGARPEDYLYDRPTVIVVPGRGTYDKPHVGVGPIGVSLHFAVVGLWWELRYLVPPGAWMKVGVYKFQVNRQGVRSADGHYTRLG